MASMRDIKRRRDSIESTQQITKAMKLVATVKLQKAKTKAEQAKPYFEKVYTTIQSILSKSGSLQHPYLIHNNSDKKGILVVTSNRGLAGGYNNNVVKKIEEMGWEKDQVRIYGVGKKGIEALNHRGYSIFQDDSDVINEPLFSDAAALGDQMLAAYNAGEIGEIWLAYTFFTNTVVHVPTLLKLLPVEVTDFVPETEEGEEDGKTEAQAPMNYEPEAEEALNMLIPKYMNSTIYGALIEAVASENGARMQAMDSATSNAEEMIANLSLAYNRARQGAITQELTEIISGAEALS